MEIKKYPISESLARRAKEMNSHSDYAEGLETSRYATMIRRFEAEITLLVERHGMTAEQEESVSYYADRYSQKLAEAYNRKNRIGSMCPSVLVSGAGNFPVAKKRKQNAADDKFWRECGDLFSPTQNYYFNKIHAILTNKTIYSNDAFAIEKLQNKLSDLEENHAEMKSRNAYYRKHGTMKGYEGMSDEEAEKMDANTKASMWNNQPYPSYHLTSNNAEMKRIKERIAEITKLKEEAEKPAENKYPQVDGVEVVENAEAMRIQLFFDGKPDEETRSILKSNGFRWSPSFGAWQRQLTANGIAATRNMLKKMICE